MIIIIVKRCYFSVEASIKYIEDFILINRIYLKVRVVNLRVAGDYLIEFPKYIIEIGNYLLNINIEIGVGGICPNFNNIKSDTLIVIPNIIDFFQFK